MGIILIMLFLTVGKLSAQTLTVNTILGTYRIAQCAQPVGTGGKNPVNYIATIEKARVDKALANLKRTNPGYTTKDSIQVVAYTSPQYAAFAPMRFTYLGDMTMLLVVGKQKPELATWVYNTATQQLTLTYTKKKVEVLQAEDRDGIIYLLQKAKDGTVTLYVKEQ